MTPVAESAPATTKKITASRLCLIFFLLGGILLGFSVFLPWGHSRTHWKYFLESYEMFHMNTFEFDDVPWGDRIYLLAKGGLGAITPIIIGLGMIAAAFLKKTRLSTNISLFTYNAFFLVNAIALALYAIIIWEDTQNPESATKPYAALGTAIILTLIAIGQTALFFRIRKKQNGISDKLHIFPLALLLIGGFAAAASQWNNDQWHAFDYLIMGAGAVFGIIGIYLRRKIKTT